jgi:hypothetical protein
VFTLKSLRLPRLLRSSIKALEVAIDQYIEGTSKRNESCVESCDKAIELILKAKVTDVGESIKVMTKRGLRTLYIHEALDILEKKKGIKVPERKKLVSIHKRRNPTHHEGETVSRAHTKSVLKTTYKFIERFLKDEFNLGLKDVVKPQYYEVLDQNISKTGQLMKIISEGHGREYRLDEARIDVPKEYETIEIYLNQLAKKKKLRLGRQQSLSNKSGNNRSLRMSKIVDVLIADQTLPEEMRKNFDIISKMYDKAVNTQEEITWDDYNPYALAMMRLKSKLELIQLSSSSR